MSRLLMLVPFAIALAACGDANSPTTGANATPTAVQQSALAAANQFRAAAGVPLVNMNNSLNVAAVRHAGYQAIKFGGAVQLSHFESTNGASGGPADTGNALFTAVQFGDRIRAANGNADLYTPGHVYYEGISSLGGPQAIASLWNTVYHRLPLCRNEVVVFGFGDQDAARTQYPSAGIPSTTPGVGYATTEYAGPGGTTVTNSFWPNDNATGVPASFNTDTESPDPLAAGNANQSPSMPAVGTVGPPIHIIIPTSKDWTSIAVTLNASATPATQLSVYVLAGFGNGSTAFPSTVPGITTSSNVINWCWDNELLAGEIFIMPAAALVGATTYQYAVTATTVGPSADTATTGGTISFSTP